VLHCLLVFLFFFFSPFLHLMLKQLQSSFLVLKTSG
jgi:hypothetical protein